MTDAIVRWSVIGDTEAHLLIMNDSVGVRFMIVSVCIITVRYRIYTNGCASLVMNPLIFSEQLEVARN